MITIAHLYYDLMNLYGENGNIKALKYQLEKQGFEVKLELLTLQDKIDFKKYDFVYIGSGTENNQKIVLNDLMKYQNKIKEYILSDKAFLATGNSIELFGKSITTKNNNKYKALNIFNFVSKEGTTRYVDEAIVKCIFINKPIIGFQNQSGIMEKNTTPLFTVIKGIGSCPNSNIEGVIKNNFWGTYLIGPILVRNPELLEYFIKNIVLEKNHVFKFNPFDFELEEKAYNSYIDNYYKDIVIEKNS